MDTDDPGHGYLGKLDRENFPKELFWHEYRLADWPTLYVANPSRPGANLSVDVLLNVIMNVCENPALV